MGVLVSFYSTSVTFIYSGGPSGGQVFLIQLRSLHFEACLIPDRNNEERFLIYCGRIIILLNKMHVKYMQ